MSRVTGITRQPGAIRRATNIFRSEPRIQITRSSHGTAYHAYTTLPQRIAQSLIMVPFGIGASNIKSTFISALERRTEKYLPKSLEEISAASGNLRARYRRLLIYAKVQSRLLYGRNFDSSLLTSALKTCVEFTDKRRSFSGETYLEHDLKTLEDLVYNFKLFDPQILAAVFARRLLYLDVFSKESLEMEYGVKVARLAAGYFDLKLSAEEKQLGEDKILEISVRRWLEKITEADDFGIVLIKLASRRTNWPTLGTFSPEDKKLFARGNLNILAPIADALGLTQIACEFEDMSFAVIDPDNYLAVAKRIEEIHEKNEAFYIRHVRMLQNQLLKLHGLTGNIVLRRQNVFRTYMRVERLANADRRPITPAYIAQLPVEEVQYNKADFIIYSMHPEDASKGRDVVEYVFGRLKEKELVLSETRPKELGLEILSHRHGGVDSFRTLVITKPEYLKKTMGVVDEINTYGELQEGSPIWKNFLAIARKAGAEEDFKASRKHFRGLLIMTRGDNKNSFLEDNLINIPQGINRRELINLLLEQKRLDIEMVERILFSPDGFSFRKIYPSIPGESSDEWLEIVGPIGKIIIIMKNTSNNQAQANR